MRASFWFWGTFGCLLVAMIVRFILLQEQDETTAFRVDSTGEATAEGIASSPAAESAPWFEGYAYQFVGPRLPGEVITDTLDRDDSIYLSLKDHQLSHSQIGELTQALQKVFRTRTDSRPRDWYTLTLDTSGVVQRFEYISHREPERPVVVERRDGQLVSQRLELPLDTRTTAIEVRIEDNLANAIDAAGEGNALTDMLADDIFGSVVDFSRDPRRGDRLGLVFEKLYQDDRFVRYGHILLARYEGQVVSRLGVYFADAEDQRGYYDAEGKSLQRMFMLYALPYRGITSHFNHRRFHPVLKRTIPHLGTDYAAGIGTQVWATSRGRVTFAGWKGALGKAVIVEHANGYVTRYGHLSKILVRKGQYVQQKELIGKVGATGRVTGPHLHYEIIKDGRHFNPESVNKGAKGQPLKERYLAAFRAHRDSLLTLLEQGLSGRTVAIHLSAATAAAE